ncbi:TIM barrel protein [uncultured Polaribacter sp.]|uniref:sugar phosphate isomerase/epimerase family protein n=1 Tax=uncultured Polaribacter sp. TaxID=174711 RepID=UPI002627AA0F|nr:TIM barrel protein [uncultured Polaribacter sp.]
MSNTINFSRREFTKLSATALAAIPLLSFQNSMNLFSSKNNTINVHLFSKHLQFLNYDDMSEAAADIGFDGLDLTVRRKGHVLPENVQEDLPKAVDAMKKFGLNPKLMSTNVWDATSTTNKMVLETASKLGFKYYRTDWLKYPESKTITESQQLFGEQANELEKLNKKHGLIGGYQNHSGKYVGAPVWDLIPVLEATKGEFIGAQYDIRHAVAEGGQSWELGFKRIQPFINTLVIKDFKWGIVKGKWKPVSVPLGEGMVDFNRYFSLLKKQQINVPISLHVEHDLGGAERGFKNITISKKEVFARIKKDLIFLREAWEKTE